MMPDWILIMAAGVLMMAAGLVIGNYVLASTGVLVMALGITVPCVRTAMILEGGGD